VRTAVGNLDAGGVRAGLGGGDAAALGDRLLGVEVDRVDDVPLLDGAPQVAAAAVHPRAVRRRHRGTDPVTWHRTNGGARFYADLEGHVAPASPAAAGRRSFF